MERLRRRADFEQVFSSGRMTGGRTLAVRYLGRGEGPSRVGFAVGKRLDRRAVVRNRIRRRLREALRPLALQEGFDIVILARRPALAADFRTLRTDVRKVLTRARLLQEQEPES